LHQKKKKEGLTVNLIRVYLNSFKILISTIN